MTRTPSATRTPSPTQPSAKAYAIGIVLNEFLANPKTDYSDEWVELYNSGSSAADLAGWKLDDGEGGGSPHTLPANTTLDPGGYLVIHLPGALLNNGGDTVRLIRPDGKIADQFSYSASTADLSFCLIDRGWVAECSPTPGQPNPRPATSIGPSATDQPVQPATVEAAPPDGSSAGAAAGATEAPHEPIVLSTPAADTAVYGLALPGSLYRGVDPSTPTPQPAPTPTRAPRRSAAVQASTVPAGPIGGGLLIVAGLIAAVYDRLRPGTSAADKTEAHPPDDVL